MQIKTNARYSVCIWMEIIKTKSQIMREHNNTNRLTVQ